MSDEKIERIAEQICQSIVEHSELERVPDKVIEQTVGPAFESANVQLIFAQQGIIENVSQEVIQGHFGNRKQLTDFLYRQLPFIVEPLRNDRRSCAFIDNPLGRPPFIPRAGAAANEMEKIFD